MTTASGAMIFGARHEQLPVTFGLKGVIDTGVETGPTGAAVKFHIRCKQWLSASGTYERAFSMFIVQRTGKAAFRAFFPQNVILLVCQRFTPILVGFLDLVGHKLGSALVAVMIRYPQQVNVPAQTHRGMFEILFSPGVLVNAGSGAQAMMRDGSGAAGRHAIG